MKRTHMLRERFEIANEAGEIEFEARVRGSGRVALLDRTRQVVASSYFPAFRTGVDIRLAGKYVATVFHVAHTGGAYPVPATFGIPSAFGELEATCHGTGYGARWTLTRDGVRVATEEDQILKDDPVRGTDQYQVEITDGENAAFVLATLFAVRYLRY